uniref:Serine-threonine/tyrosine-protein kinase catalytic domain-containing protein n=1 Tax=Trichuris muris TaxID=70415 RepID=A0A5S6QCK1_TRIMR
MNLGFLEEMDAWSSSRDLSETEKFLLRGKVISRPELVGNIEMASTAALLCASTIPDHRKFLASMKEIEKRNMHVIFLPVDVVKLPEVGKKEDFGRDDEPAYFLYMRSTRVERIPHRNLTIIEKRIISWTSNETDTLPRSDKSPEPDDDSMRLQFDR